MSKLRSETHFTNGYDPDPRARRVFAFPKPATLARAVRDADADPDTPTWRGKAHHLPPLDEAPLRDAQVAAIRGIERALAEQRYSRSLVQMATGAGKTYAAVTEAYRLLKWGGFSKVLFLVDRNNLQEITPGGSVRRSTSRRGPSRARSWRESRAGTDRSRVVGTVGDRRM